MLIELAVKPVAPPSPPSDDGPTPRREPDRGRRAVTSRGGVPLPSDRPRHRPGADRVPADLSTAHLRIVPAFVGWEDPGARSPRSSSSGRWPPCCCTSAHDLLADRDAPGCASLRSPALRRDLDARMGWYIILGTIPIGDLRPGVQGPDRERRARPLPDRRHADRVRASCCCWPTASGTRSARRRRHRRAATAIDRLRAGARARAGRLALGRHDHRRRCSSASRARPRRATRSCSRSRPSCCAGCSSCATLAATTADAGVGADRVATVLAFIVGYASIALLLRWLSSHSTAIFVAYRIGLGTVVLALAGSGAISYDRAPRGRRGQVCSAPVSLHTIASGDEARGTS